MDNNLQQGILAAKAGNKPRAFDLLTRASQDPATSEQAWLWLSSVVNDDSERLFCLDSALRINSANVHAQRGAAMLRQKGVFPSMPAYPETPKAAPAPDFSSKHIPASKSSQTNFVTPTRTQTTYAPPAPIPTSSLQQKPSYETELKKQELSGYFQYATMELANSKPRQAIEKSLISQGLSPEVAKTVVDDAKYVIRKARREKYKKQMMRGLLWTVGGTVVTCGTLVFASQLGGRYVLFYGAILYGVINLIVGIIGWLTNL